MNPDFFFGGAGLPVPPGFGQGWPPDWGDHINDRMQRLQCIAPYMFDIRVGQIPTNFKPEELRCMVTDLKDEGNDRFKAKNYTGACEMYTMALNICRHLQFVHHIIADRELLSTLYSNRAACYLKIDMYKESIEDCEIALQQNKDNIKAHYRKAVAQKLIRDYQSALNSAIAGRDHSVLINRLKEAKEFEELICEVKSHLPAYQSPAVSSSVTDVTLANQAEKQSEKRVEKKTKKTVINVAGSNLNVDLNVEEGNSRSSSMSSGSNSVSRNTRAAKESGDTLLHSQLDDNLRSAVHTQKVAPSKKKKKKKKKKATAVSQYHGRFSTLQDADTSDSNNTKSSDGDRSDSDERESVASSSGLGRNTRSEHGLGKSESMGLDDFTMQENMGLDDFTLPVSAQDNIQSVARSSVPRIFASSPVATQQHKQQLLPAPRQQEQQQHQQQQQQQQQHQYPPSSQYLTTRASSAPGVVSKAPKELLSGELMELETDLELPYPFNSYYDFTLVCEKCYPQRRPGHDGYVALVFLPHHCALNVFLVRSKGDVSARWAKVRPRNIKVVFRGSFKLCRDFTSDVPCNQLDCSFAHYEEELNLWTLDRDQEINIVQFIADVKLKLLAGLMWFREPELQHSAVVKPLLPPDVSQPPVTFQDRHKHVGYTNSQHLATKQWVNSDLPQTHLLGNSLGQQGVIQSGDKVPFPLSSSFRYCIVCDECLVPVLEPLCSYMLAHPAGHQCSENVLAVQQTVGDEYWVKIRERVNHRQFSGTYMMCLHFASNNICSHGEKCLFAHSLPEQMLWTEEKDGRFSRIDFILQNKSTNVSPVASLTALLAKFPGEFCFLCQTCYFEQQRIVIEGDAGRVCGQGLHDWSDNKMLAHYNADTGCITPIGTRHFTHKESFYSLCRYMQFCQRQLAATCAFAHSVLERDIWYIERDFDITQDQIVEEINKLLAQQNNKSAQHSPATHNNNQTSTQTTTREERVHTPPVVSQVPSHATPTKQNKLSEVAQAVEHTTGPGLTAPPPAVVEVCGFCFDKGIHSVHGVGKADGKCSASGVSHTWGQNKVYVIMPSKKKLKSLPKIKPVNCKYTICHDIENKKKCNYSSKGMECQFAHSQEEVDVWKWMVVNNVTSLAEAASLYQNHIKKKAATAVASKVIPRGQTVVVPTAPLPRQQAPLLTMVNAHYCHYCGIHCNSQKQWDEHCASDKHRFNVNSDKEHQWNYRQPPWGISGGSYELCPHHADGAKCKFSDVPDVHNQCKFAHCVEELDEWKERWDWRQMKRDMAKQEHLFSYMDELREDYENAVCGIDVISEQLDGVKIGCDSNLHKYEERKDAKCSWIFELRVSKGKMLSKVALLHDHDRLHFSLRGDGLDGECQIGQGDAFLQPSRTPVVLYKVEVAFVGGIFGSFSQWVIFDFDQRPVVARKLVVELGTSGVHDQVRTLRKQLEFDRWTTENHEVVWFDTVKQAVEGDLNSYVLQHYKAPSSADAVITQHSLAVELNRHNYVHKMHKLLYIEELTQAQIMARYNLTTEVTLVNTVHEFGASIFARPGELFAKVPLNEQLNEDTDAGHLLLSGSTCVLLALQSRDRKRVYEAVLVQKENFDYNGRGSDYIYLCLSERCCIELGLHSNDRVEIEVQFQMNRLPFCQMHYAIDQLSNPNIVFPDVSKINHNWNESRFTKFSSSTLNEDQLKVLDYAVAERQDYTVPLVIYGPFGTGKTETLAQATMIMSAQRIGARILICTHSNSAADVYILRHLDPFLKHSGRHVKVLRVVATDRRLNTIPAIVKQYCLMSPNNSQILAPTREDILSHDIVITTLVTSLVLTTLDIKGCFTHIFVDEAAQVFECEAVMPLLLADESTRIVLAGDYYQMTQKVYSTEAKRQKFHCSLVERLFHHYKTFAGVADKSVPTVPSNNILLSSNYRTKMEIVRFIAAVFYGDPDVLRALGNIPNVLGVIPLTFYTAQGREVQESDSTSYYNLAEVEEIVERVTELVQYWPEEWNEAYVNPASSILVVTPYLDQVLKIRAALRKKGRELKLELNRVVVERVIAIQGNEFRAVFLSPVRTRHLVEELPRSAGGMARECDGDFGDFGFLSDPKLLNTALTRAISLAVVVGDPVILCAVGECTTIWRAFLKHCQNLGSIHPRSVTLDSVRTQVITLMSSQYGANIQRLNKLNQQGVIIDESSKTDVLPEDKQVEELAAEFSDVVIEPNPFESVTVNGVFEDWNLDYHIEPDSILEQLTKEAQKSAQRSKDKQKARGASGTVEAKGNGRNGMAMEDYSGPADPLKVSCVHIHNGHAILHCNESQEKKTVKKRTLLTAEDSYTSYNSDEDELSESEAEYEQSLPIYVDILPLQLLEYVRRQPERYKRAILMVENTSNMYAVCIDDPLKQIKINSRLRCGRAFSNDEVVVEVLPIDPEDMVAVSDDERGTVQGQVIGIVRRAINPKYRMFVCMVEEDNTGLMVPINRSIPKIYNLETRDKLKKTKKGHVCVYTFTRSREIVFHHYEPIDADNPNSKLFIVRYLKWDSNSFSPLGIVVGVLPTGCNVELATNIINIEHYVPERYKTDTLSEVDRLFPPGYSIPESEIASRTDFRQRLTFTVDPEDSTDLDDAISLVELQNSCYVIGIHIADVGYFVRRDSCVDQEAAARGATLYPFSRKQIAMLPEQLSSDLCSLLPGQDRLTQSVLITINAKAEIQQVQVKPSVIRSQHRLTYADVEQALKGGVDGSGDSSIVTLPYELQVILLMLSRVAQIWRRNRLGTGALCYESQSAEDAHDAHMMIEELMITTNHQVALLLIERLPLTTPLRTQRPPEERNLTEWRELFMADARNTVALTPAFKKRGEVCSCVGECLCIPPSDVDPLVDIDKTVWNDIRLAVVDGNWEHLQSLVLDPQNHPKLARALLHWQNIQRHSTYLCSGDLDQDDSSESHHNSLNISLYTTFTSPIRRYVDLVVGRLVGDCLINRRPSPYSQTDIANICSRSNDVNVMARKYETATRVIHCSQYFSEHPVTAYALVNHLSEMDLELHFYSTRSLLPSKVRMLLSALSLAGTPVLSEAGDLVLKWSRRLYDLKPEWQMLLDANVMAPLCADKYIYQTNSSSWRKLVAAVTAGEHENIVLSMIELNSLLCDPLSAEGFLIDVTSEGVCVDSGKQLRDFMITLRNASLVQVQLSAEVNKGLPSPRLQLFNLTPTLDICLEHRQNAVQCFADVMLRSATRNSYPDIASYQSNWLTVLSMEAAYQAVHGSARDIILVHHVAIEWSEQIVDGTSVYTGVLQLPQKFCHERSIFFISPTEEQEEDLEVLSIQDEENDAGISSCGYMCVRYGSSEVMHKPDVNPQLAVALGKLSLSSVWVAHCIVYKVTWSSRSKSYALHIRLHQTTSTIPHEFLTSGSSLATATVEWLPKGLPNRRAENAVLHLDESTQLAKAIALCRQPQSSFDDIYMEAIEKVRSVKIAGLSAPNAGQWSAIEKALKQPFTVIQGPPGTGKTVCGVWLACLFSSANNVVAELAKDAVNKQVMICGPSNKSVDVIAIYLKKLKSACPRIVRVFSAFIERSSYPLPSDYLQSYSADLLTPSDEELKDVSLHHMVHSATADEASVTDRQLIQEIDARIRERDTSLGPEEIRQYKDAIRRTESQILKNAEIILCTCSTSCLFKISQSTTIEQLLIDECGMCTEPETLIPIVCSRANQIVLLGDHMQLEPIVMENTARKRGLTRSLFERYADKAEMLTTQYRMHEAIAAFPSTHFYSCKLTTGKDDQSKSSALKFWLNGRTKPLAFVHVMGCEQSLPVSTADGCEQSKFNLNEVDVVIKSVTKLIHRFHVLPADVAILTQYRAQCSYIERELQKRGEKDVSVSTVIAAQGSEWEYVVMSTVRSLPKCSIEKRPTKGWKYRHLGFIADSHQINVALTRAKKGLIIIGNKYLLQCDDTWKKLITHYTENKKIVNAAEFML